MRFPSLHASLLSLLSLSLILGGCTRLVWTKPFGDPSTYGADNYTCQQESLAAAHRTYLPPLYHHPHFHSLTCVTMMGNKACETTSMAGAEHMCRHVLGLPFHPFQTEQDVQDIAFILQETIHALSIASRLASQPLVA